MEFFLLLAVSTFIIIYLAIILYKRTKDFSFLLGIGLLYFFSLYGAWFLVFDNLYLEEGYNIGLNYYYIFHKVFPVHLDINYFKTLVYYSLFIIIIESVLLIMVKPVSFESERGNVLIFRHETILILSAIFLTFSLLINFKYIYEAIQEGTGVYFLIRKSTNTTIYAIQILLNKVLLILMIGYFIFLNPNLKYFINQENNNWKIKLFYPILIASWVVYLVIIGDRYGLFFSVLATLLILISLIKKVNKLKLTFFLVAVIILLGCVVILRQYSPSEMIDNFDFDLVMFALLYPLLSNEIFFAHVSLYGAMYFQVPILWGHSFMTLMVSFIPRIFGIERLQDIYDYYSSSVGALEGQVYTIHHATGWYLNYGFVGIIVGAAWFGILWGMCYRLKYFHNIDNKFLLLGKIFVPYLFVSGVPLIIRSGIEGYKSLLIEVLFLPFILMSISVKMVNKNTY